MFEYTDALITIASLNLEKLIHFYTYFLQQDPTNYIPNLYAEFQISSLKLGIFKPKQSHNDEFAAVCRSKMSLCLEVKDLDLAIAHLKTGGYSPPDQAFTADHGREIYLYDPDGNRIILHQSHNSSDQ